MTDQPIALQVSSAYIQSLVDSLRYTVTRTPNAASTTATASLPGGYVVCTANSGCLDAAAFDEETSRKMAIAAATTLAREVLWEREAYRLWHEQTQQKGAANP
jgi:hypothetical protein